MKKKVLATSFNTGAVNAISPVILKLREESRIEVVVISYGECSQRVLKDMKIDLHYRIHHLSVESLEKLLQNESPDLVLTGASAQYKRDKTPLIEHLIISAAREREIPTLAVLDSWGNYSRKFTDIQTGKQFLPDKIAIMNPYAEKAMLEEGFDKHRLVITGNPYFENLEAKARNFTTEKRDEIREKIGLKKEILVFYAGSVLEKQKNEFGYWDLDNVSLLCEVLAGLSNQNVGLVIKLHPNSSKGEQEKVIKEITPYPEIKLIKDIKAHELVLASDLILTPFSTLGIEAVCMEKPCISIQPGLKGEDYLAILTQNGYIPLGNNVKNCRTLLRKAISDKGYREKDLILKASGFKIEKNATQRIVNLIYSLLGLVY